MSYIPRLSLLLCALLLSTGCGRYGLRDRPDAHRFQPGAGDDSELKPRLQVHTIVAPASRGLDVRRATQHLAAQIARCGHPASWGEATASSTPGDAEQREADELRCVAQTRQSVGVGDGIWAHVTLSCTLQSARAPVTLDASAQRLVARAPQLDLAIQAAESDALLQSVDQLACPLARAALTPSPPPADESHLGKAQTE